MTNAELVAELRLCSDNEKQDGCDVCPYLYNGMCRTMLSDAADALEAQQTALDECARQLADMAKRIAELMPKEGEWIWENYFWHCSVCGENPTRGMGYVQGKNELFKVCPNCGARCK